MSASRIRPCGVRLSLGSVKSEPVVLRNELTPAGTTTENLTGGFVWSAGDKGTSVNVPARPRVASGTTISGSPTAGTVVSNVSAGRPGIRAGTSNSTLAFDGKPAAVVWNEALTATVVPIDSSQLSGAVISVMVLILAPPSAPPASARISTASELVEPVTRLTQIPDTHACDDMQFTSVEQTRSNPEPPVPVAGDFAPAPAHDAHAASAIPNNRSAFIAGSS